MTDKEIPFTNNQLTAAFVAPGVWGQTPFYREIRVKK
jgi:hypothetical protein